MEVVNYIVPMCNFGNDEIYYRIRALNAAIKILAKETDVKIVLITVEQIVNDSFARYHDQIESDSSITHIKKIVNFGEFNKPWLCNIGVRNALTNHVIIAETDMYSPYPYIGKGLDFVNQNRLGFAFLWNDLYYLNDDQTKNAINSNIIQTTGLIPKHPARGKAEGGVVYFNKDVWTKLGGMNEEFYGLGGMDNEIAFRFYTETKQYVCYKNTLYHLYHPSSPMKHGNRRKKNKAIFRETKRDWESVNKRLRSRAWGSENRPCV